MYKIAIGTVCGLLLFSHAAMALCSSYPYTLTNGTTADAAQVMADFNCAALTSGATIDGATMTGLNSVYVNYTSSQTGSFPFQFQTPTAYVQAALWVGLATENLATPLQVMRAGDGAYFYDTATAPSAAVYVQVDNTTPHFVTFRYGGTDVGSIATNGSSTSYNTTSDERLKDWHIPQQDYSAAIRQLWVGDYSWKKDGRPDFGYRAQQAYSLYPAAVRKPTKPDESWSMDYGKTAPLAMWGVKELSRLSGATDFWVFAVVLPLTNARRYFDLAFLFRS